MTKDEMCDKFWKKSENHFSFAGYLMTSWPMSHRYYENNGNGDRPVSFKQYILGVRGIIFSL